jgi:hypothetical protein
MPAGWPFALALILGLIALFAIVIVVGLRTGDRSQAKNLREIKADNVWAEIGEGGWPRADLLYGIWQTSLKDVVLIVRDCNDADVGTITTRLTDTAIVAGSETYKAVAGMTWSESAELVAVNARAEDAVQPASSFESKGWGGHQRAQYMIPGFGVLTIQARWSWPWKRGALPILKDGRAIGQLSEIGGPFYNKGRALALPGEIPLAVRMFILWKAAGARARTKSA